MDDRIKNAAETIRRVRPWLRSTGPRTAAGKRRSRYNARKPASAELYLAALEAGDYHLARLIWRRLFRRR
jgi:hypothetical protein